MATECSSLDSDVDLDSQIDRFDNFYFGDNGDDVEETGIVAVGPSQPGVAPYRHEPVKKSRRSKPESGGESDAVFTQMQPPFSFLCATIQLISTGSRCLLVTYYTI